MEPAFSSDTGNGGEPDSRQRILEAISLSADRYEPVTES
jgi:hypothetical protein